MSRFASTPVKSGPVKKDRSTLYGVFAVLALLPTAFSVSFEYTARGIASGRPWLMALFPMVLLVAARFIPSVWHRWRPVGWVLVGVAAVAGGLFCWHMAGLLNFLGVTTAVRFVAPAVITVMYAGFAIVMGRLRTRTGSSGTTSAASSVADADSRVLARRPDSYTH